MSSSDDGDRGYRDLARRAERLTAAMREFETLSLAVSHDFRLPLHAIDDTLCAIAEERRNVDAETRRDIHAMRDALAQVEEMISHLDELCRVNTGALTLETVDMETLVREVWARLDTGGTIAFSLGKLPMALGDRRMLRVVWRHLLVNAIARCGGRAGARIDVTGGGNSAFAVYSVRDNGTGLALHFTGKLSYSFEELQKQSTHPGFGIALAIVQRLVTRHRGNVWVEAIPEKGNFFQFSIGEIQEQPPPVSE